MGARTTARIARLEAELTRLDNEIAKAEFEQTQVGSVGKRRPMRATLEAERKKVEEQLSLLYALQKNGGRTIIGRGGY